MPIEYNITMPRPRVFILCDIEDRWGREAMIQLEIFECGGRMHNYLAAIFLAQLFDLMATREWN
jgi:hypothetical protein